VASAYSVFGNEGYYEKPKFYKEVKDKNGKVILSEEHEKSKILSAEASYLTYELLKGVAKDGTGKNANFGSMPVGGKTGTTSDSKDVWFAGLTPYYSGAIWLGKDNNESLNTAGSNSVANAWGIIMKEANKGLQIKDIEKPENIVYEDICTESGQKATKYCKSANTVSTEPFIKGTEPSKECEKHSFFNNKSDKDNNNNEESTKKNPVKNFFNNLFNGLFK
jgi:penicillin-binding protein 1A